MKAIYCFLFIIFIFVFSPSIQAKYSPEKISQKSLQKNSALDPQVTLSNINNWAYWMSNDGASGHNPHTGDGGGIYPRSTIAAIFQDGLIWGTQVQGNVRVGGQTYNIGTQPLLDHIYRIRKNWADLTISNVKKETAEFYNISVETVTNEQANEIIEQYKKDWKEWPVAEGAPFIDADENGAYNPTLDSNGMPDAALGDYPGYKDADQVIWFKVDDQDASKTKFLYGSDPIGIELQVTVWGYEQPNSTIGQAIFKKYKIINTSGNDFDEMYLAQWVDPDLGDFTDDLAGCDRTLSAGFVYNGTYSDNEYDKYGLVPPSTGYVILQGPVVPSVGDTAWFDSGLLPDFKNLPLTSFSYFSSGSPINDPQLSEYSGTLQWYNMLRGNTPTTDLDNPVMYTHGSGPNIGQSTKFPLDGDPVIGSGDIDGKGDNMPPGDRRIVLSSGPFVLSPGDSQEMVVAVVGGQGNNYLNSIIKLKTNIEFIQGTYLSNFDENSFKDPRVSYQINIPGNTSVELFIEADLTEFDAVNSCTLDFKPQIGSESSFTVTLYDDGQHNDQLAGDNIWANTVTETNRKYPYSADLLLSQDSGDKAYTNYFSSVRLRPAPTLENWHIVWENRKQDLQINNSETVHLQFDIFNNDALNAVDSLSLLKDEEFKIADGIAAGGKIEFNTHFFIVSAPASGDSITFTYQMNYDHHLEVVNKTMPLVLFEEEYGVIHAAHTGNSDATVAVKVLEPDSLTGDEYKVFFGQQPDSNIINEKNTANNSEMYWYLKNITKDVLVLENQTVFDGVDIYTGEEKGDPIVDGFMITVKGTYTAPKTFSSAVLYKENGSSTSVGDPSPTYKGIGDYYRNGWAEDATSVSVRGFGSNDPDELGNDYECRWTGVYKDTPTIINGDTVWEVESGGSMASLYGARNDNLANHPLNPNFGTEAPFLVRIPFEVWNEDTGEQINLSIYDRKQVYNGSKPIYAFNPFDRMYTEFVNTPYDPTHVIPEDGGADADHFTWNLVWWGKTDFENGDTLRVKYESIITSSDTFQFTAEKPTAIRNTSVLNEFRLSQNYPNPFNPVTTISYSLSMLSHVELTVYNLLGQKVCTLVNKKQEAGLHKLQFNAANLASGVYLYRIKADHFITSKKMLLLK